MFSGRALSSRETLRGIADVTGTGSSIRLTQLDCLRAIAVLLVLGRHMRAPPAASHPLILAVATLWARCGWVGVDLFFVLSGFLVSGLLFREFASFRTIHFGQFFIRRGMKIYPPFYFFLAFTLIVPAITLRHVPPLDMAGLIGEVLFIQNYGLHLWNHTWSLAVEEHFYLLIGVLLAFRARSRSERPFAILVPTFVVIAVVALLIRIIVATRLPFGNYSVYPTHIRIDSLSFGVLISYFHHVHGDALATFVRRRSIIILALSSLLVAPSVLLTLESSPFMYTAGFTGLYLGFGGVLLVAIYAAPPRGLFVSRLASMGEHSYSVYLWHMHMQFWPAFALARILGRPPAYLLEIALYFTAAIAIGIMFSKLIEIPTLRIRNRLFPSRSAPLGRTVIGEPVAPAAVHR